MGTVWTCFAGGTVIAAATLIASVEFAGPDDVVTPSAEPDVTSSVDLSGADRPGHWKSFDEMHEHYTHQFVEAEGFGISRIVTFTEPEFRQLFVNGTPYRLQGLRMIGLTSEVPVMYLPSWIGLSRRQLDEYPKRVLLEAEERAVQKLKTGTDYVWYPGHRQTALPVSSNNETIPVEHTGRLIAGLKASASCTNCHDVAEGTLLGAFVYELLDAEQHPLPLFQLPIPEAPATEKPVALTSE